ncbi:hypothetical protein Q9Q94_16885, partial [Uliginosibacterium sp. 31-16]|uniref:hypothetical protein n=1 Tax=Uliginosibacterium sp. 31-16 TaxID=3068315 RepID=UPI00273DB8F7
QIRNLTQQPNSPQNHARYTSNLILQLANFASNPPSAEKRDYEESRTNRQAHLQAFVHFLL